MSSEDLSAGTESPSAPLYRLMFDQCRTPAVVYDTSMRIVDCNAAMVRLLRVPRDRILRRRIDGVSDDRYREALRRALVGEEVRYDSPYPATASDPWLWGPARFQPVRDATGAVVAVMVTTAVPGALQLEA